MTKTFLRGLAIVLPITITAYFIYWLGTTAEATLGGALRPLLSEDLYVPGMGVMAGVALVFVVGLLARLWLMRTLIGWGERVLEKIPLVKTIYGSVRDLMSFFSADKKDKLDQVVLVTLVEGSPQLLGFLTREALDEFDGAVSGENPVAVYLPMSYQIGGFTVLVPRSRVTPTKMSIEDGMRFAMTAGVSASAAAAVSSP